MTFKGFLNILLIGLLCFQCTGQEPQPGTSTEVVVKPVVKPLPIVVGAAQTNRYLPLLEGKRVALVANHTAMINDIHLVDSLLALKVNVVKVFSPEHGFRGKADAGEKVSSDKDPGTGLAIVSLYGNNKKPTAEQLKGIDVVLFDIQDVGARFYTYISTMHYVMEACAESKIKLIVLDRPNPNGHYVDGPILDPKFKSFIGMHPVPIVHGMTVGEYAWMINGEGWLANGISCNLDVIPVEYYNHTTFYELPIKPSPNLPNMGSVYLYPSLCLFEGTPISIGRGTDKPFQVVGHPKIESDRYSFTPQPTEGAKHPKLENELCHGYDLSTFGQEYIKSNPKINLFWLIDVYSSYPEKDKFFNESFNLLAGSDQLQKQLKEGVSEQEIYKSWQPGLKAFKVTRKKYLLYEDFE
ncbi:MAG: DUF1343 domain-containing protein [Flavobacteriales bacterium]|nr:DUF1343 domain-containing protein [Flavobacteriales bacterium]